MKDNKNIKCEVFSCKFCDFKSSYCTKKIIKVCTCKGDDKEGTMCDSYLER